ncbi:MAG: DNA-directed RNA polymerase subunit delta [Acholeplasmatales bacterium]|nr:DNA-directed RNA polymerase subunit delta [Acholeplasmatales bacterium]
MENNYSNKSLLEIAYELTKESVDGYAIDELLDKTIELKGLDPKDVEIRSALYIDICSSSKFVYLADGKWDLKTRHSLDEYDKDGSKLYSAEELEDEAEEVSGYEDEDDDENDIDDDDEDDDDDDEDDDDDDNDDEYLNSEDSYSDSSEDEDYIDDEDSLDEDFDEQKYNDTMDEYEDKYDR